MNDNLYVKIFLPPLTDLRHDPNSGAQNIIIKDAKGFFIMNARPPQSIADHQNKLRGCSREIFCDDDNEAKHVRGIYAPLPEDQHIVRGKLEAELRTALVEFKGQIPRQTIDPEF